MIAKGRRVGCGVGRMAARQRNTQKGGKMRFMTVDRRGKAGKGGCTRWRKRFVAAALAVCLCASMLSGCKSGGGQEDGGGQEESEDKQGDIIIRVGDKEVARDEIMFYVLCVRQQYEGYFGSEIWSVDFGGGQTFEDMCKEDVMNEIIQLKVITSMAEQQNVVVTEDEADEIADTVREQLEEITGQDAVRYNITTELLERIYHDNYLSSKMFDVATANVDTNVADEEARCAQFQVLGIVLQGEDKNGNEVSLTEEERTNARERAEELREQAEGSADFYSLAAVHSELDEVEMTISRGVMGDAFDEGAFALKTGELSPVIDGGDAYYIVYCADEMDEDATAQAKEAIISDRQDEAFCSMYEEWAKQFTVEVDEEKWTGIRFYDKTPDIENTVGRSGGGVI